MPNQISIDGIDFKKYIEETDIVEKINQISYTINSEYKDKDPIFIVILNGSFMFASDLVKRFSGHCQLAFVKLSSYDKLESSGKVREVFGLDIDINGKDVIIVEDIVDTGLTLEFFISRLHEHNPKSVRIATLLLKPDSFNNRFPVDYVGFEIPNDFIVGYGLDLDGYGRNYPHIYKKENK
ncbi:MAG: hypoxanthine phosphoribosyltransferase [Lentimicrobiaceae bacterium]|nr:hypoxanthine phosphoribosyltransferase [Lentimicrobiaceae bacterium]